jgi:hypothetical protein
MTVIDRPTRRAHRLLLSPLVAFLLLLPMCDSGRMPTLKGNAYVTVSCISWAGITWSAYTSNFINKPDLPGITKIHYHATVRYNSEVIWEGWSGWYHTNSIGNHFQWPANSGHEITCGSGVYSVEVYASNESGTWHTFSGWDEVACE